MAIFVHGLGETDGRGGCAPTRERPGYGACLQRDLGHTPIELRYNTGLHISDNGRALAGLLEELCDAWPVAVRRSSSSDIRWAAWSRAAPATTASGEGHRWTGAVRHVFCLGSPHLGAPLEKGVNALGWALGRVPEARPLANVLNVRSAGIKDLRYGSCAEEDWCDCDPDELLHRPLPRRALPARRALLLRGGDGQPAPRRPAGRHSRRPARARPSASGAGRRRQIGFAVEDGHHVGGVTHFDLLNHPAVYDQIRAWIER